MCKAKVSANMIAKLKNGQYITLDKVEGICGAMTCIPDDILDFTVAETSEEGAPNDV